MEKRWASYIARQPIAVASTLLLLADDVCNTMWPAESHLADTFGQERPDASSSPRANFWDAHSFVMRVATVEIFHRPLLESHWGETIHIKPKLTAIGNSSFRFVTDFFVQHKETFILVAREFTQCVLVSRQSLRPTPLPDREMLLSRITEKEPSIKHLATHFDSPIPDQAFHYAAYARKSDCDNLGHLNNSKYAIMAEEALCTATHQRYYPSDSPASDPVASIHIEYQEQILPFVPLEAYVWTSPGAGNIFLVRFVIKETGAVASSIVLQTSPRAESKSKL